MPAAEVAAQDAFPYARFDSRGAPFGWRALAASGCSEAAVARLEAYAGANAYRLTSWQSTEIAFHISQALAMAGREEESVASFERALDDHSTPEWATYVKATLAFLRRDRAALQAARATYADLAPGSMRLRIIDGFLACPAKPYMTAAHCQP